MNYWRILQLWLAVMAVLPSSGAVIINEIHYDPPIKTELTEFIELHNSGSAPVDLSRWEITEGVSFSFPPGTTIPAGGYLVVAENPAALQAKFGATAAGPWSGLLANDGETITLRNASGEVVDKVDYKLGFPWPTVGDPPGYSIELVNPAFDNDLGGSWRRSLRGAPPAQSQVLIPERSVWKYQKGTAEPSFPISAWRALTFNDAGWGTGAAPVGYDGNIVMGTALADMRGNFTSIYLRKTFEVADPAAVASLTLGALYDDGIQVWINGRRVLNAALPDRDVAYSELATGVARESSAYDPFTISSPGAFLVAGQNVIAVQVHNIQITESSDAYADIRLIAQLRGTGAEPTPGARNAVYDTTLPPHLRQMNHSPEQPKAGEPVKITARITDPDGVGSARLLYQIVEPGNYIELKDAAYEASWTPAAMTDSGTGGDELANDGIYTVILPGSLQVHRRLVRYRIEATDAGNRTIRAPYLDDPTPNFAYFVYNGVPDWQAAVRPGITAVQNFSAAEMGRLETYHLIAKRASVETATWTSKYGGDEYLWGGALVYDGKVYDHIRYRARGGVWRYAMGKNMWKFDFNRGHDFEARDNYGERYKTKWRKLNLGANIQQGDYQHRGEQGMFESVGFRLFNMAGVESPNSHWVNYRVVDDAQESLGSNQFGGDYWGLYLAVEQEDGRFLDEHDLPDGNLYKMEGGTGELNNQGRYSATDKSDLNSFLNTYRNTTPTEEWWRQNADLEKIYSYHAIVEGIHHYDICFGKNYFYFLNPVTGQWAIHTWDLDLTWADNMYGSSCDDIRDRIITRTPFNIEYRNRVREVRDLLFNTDQAWKVIDEYAGIVKGTNAGPSILAADRSMWDYNPVMTNGAIVNPGKAGQGRFYTFPLESASNPSRRGSFEAAVLIMKDYVVKRAGVLDRLAADLAIPGTPTLASVGATNYPLNRIELQASWISSTAPISAIQWRLGEIRTAAPGVPGKYEIETAWESPEFTVLNDRFTLPAEAMKVGHTYRARVKVKDSTGRWSHWSAPVEFTASEPDNSAALQEFLRLTELMYNPPLGSDFEFIELYNSSTSMTLELGGATFVEGISYSFPSGTTLAPGEYALVVRADAANDFALFRQHYSITANGKLLGPYSGSLNNDGERLTLKTAAAGAEIFSFTYNDGPGWPKAADGTGHSLEHGAGSFEYGRNWIASSAIGGSPLANFWHLDDRMVINEIGAHTDYSDPARPEYDSNDWIELFNRGSQFFNLPVNLRDYYLSDDASDLKKWRLPDVMLPVGGHISFDEVTHFHNPITSGFGIDKAGETIFLSEFVTNGTSRVVDAVRFGGQENGFGVGRYPDGGEFLYTLIPSRDRTNAPAAPNLVFTEVMYHPREDTNGVEAAWQEFIEIQNTTATPIKLSNTNGGFRLNGGVSFTFPENLTIPANGVIVVTSFSSTNSPQTAAFNSFYEIVNSNVTIVGPFLGQLANSSDRITLEKPDAPDASGEPLVWITMDEMIYTDASGADGTAETLNRITGTRSGNDPANFLASAATPGSVQAQPFGDRDQDGLPDEWETRFSLNPSDAADAAFDTDFDGLTNLAEYRAGTDPTSSASRLALAVTRDGPATLLTFSAIAGRSYSVQFRDDLNSGTWQKLRDVSGTSGSVTIADPAPSRFSRYYRLVTPSLP